MTQRFTMPTAAHLFLRRGREVLQLRRFGTGYEDDSYSVIAGHLDGGEGVVAAAVREAREEAGIAIAPEDVRVVGVMHRISNDERIDFFVEAWRWSGGVANAEPHRCDDLAWFALDALPDNIARHARGGASGSPAVAGCGFGPLQAGGVDGA